VPNLSILRNYKEIWNFTKISVISGVYQPNPWPSGPTLQPLTGWLHGDTLQEAVEGNPMLKVGGGQTPWLTRHMARPPSHHLACYRLNQVGNPSLNPHKYPLLVEIKTTHSICSSPLVNVWFSSSSTVEALSRVDSSIHSSSGSSLRDR
jgi:hypothetical protein